MTKIALTDPIPLQIQLECHENATFFVRANIKNSLGAIVASDIELTDFGEGLFFDNSQSMSFGTIIIAQYFVFTDALFTNLSTEYCGPFNDIFTLEIDVAQLDGEITGEILSPENIVGEITSPENLIGIIECE